MTTILTDTGFPVSVSGPSGPSGRAPGPPSCGQHVRSSSRAKHWTLPPLGAVLRCVVVGFRWRLALSVLASPLRFGFACASRACVALSLSARLTFTRRCALVQFIAPTASGLLRCRSPASLSLSGSPSRQASGSWLSAPVSNRETGPYAIANCSHRFIPRQASGFGFLASASTTSPVTRGTNSNSEKTGTLSG